MVLKRCAGRYPCFSLKPVTLAVLAALSSPVSANPVDGTVVHGNATIQQSGNTLTITNTPNTIINWQSFSIGQGEVTRIVQESADSKILNRVLLGGDPSVLLGTLQSNGRVFLINPAGILVGQGARIDVGGLVASTQNLSKEDFLAGRYHFTPALTAGGIVNHGNITTREGGSVYLIAANVENHGIITTPKGETILAAGSTVKLLDTSTPGVSVEITGSGNVTNLGQILADSGRIGMVGAVVRNGGVLNASSLASEGGRIFLRATQAVSVEGDSLVSATGTKGGHVEVLGREVSVSGRSVVDVSGTAGGGQILLGGDVQGKNPAVQNALSTRVDQHATLRADATDEGEGGKIVVWADDSTEAHGAISARGGVNGGNGGFVETSGKNRLQVVGVRVNTSAARGRTGTWLLDPANFTIAASGGDRTGAEIAQDLVSNNIIILSSMGATDGDGDINVNDAIAWTSGNSLTLSAYHSVNINNTIAGNGQVSVRADNTGSCVAGAASCGTVNFGGAGHITAPTVNLYYNPIGSNLSANPADGSGPSYASPTDFSARVTGNLKAHMLVNDINQLQAMLTNLSGRFALGRDIDATASQSWNAGAGFNPVGNDTNAFTGQLDGLGHRISALNINRTTTNYVGLFGNLSNTAGVANVGLVGGSIKGQNFVGGLAGQSSGSISNSYSTAAVSGLGIVGGLAGQNSGSISNSYSTAVVSGLGIVGGLVGNNSGQVAQTYSSGQVSGTNTTGGLIGANSGTVSQSYWDTDASGQSSSAGGTGKSSAQMKQADTFAGWAIATTGGSSAVWRIYEGDTAPLLRSFLAPLTVTANNASKTYDGLLFSGGNGVSYSGFKPGDSATSLSGTLTFGGTAQGAKNAGNYTLSAGGYYSGQQGYDIEYVDGALTINKADLALSGTRSYDGTTIVAGSTLTATGVANETFTVTGSGDISNLSSKNASSTSQTLALLTGLTLGSSANGGDANNYNALSIDGSSYTVTRADYTAISGSKTYNGNDGFSNVAVQGVAGETFTLASATANSKNVADANRFISTSGAITGNGGALTSNYNDLTLSGTGAVATNSATVTPATIANVSGITADNKTYDGTTAASLNTANAGFNGLYAGDSLTVASASGAFVNAAPGSDKPVNISAISLGGADAGNYRLLNNTATTTATIFAPPVPPPPRSPPDLGDNDFITQAVNQRDVAVIRAGGLTVPLVSFPVALACVPPANIGGVTGGMPGTFGCNPELPGDCLADEGKQGENAPSNNQPSKEDNSHAPISNH